MKLSLVFVLLCCLLHLGLARGPLRTSGRQESSPCLSVCFVLDGSSSPKDFQDQKNFADLLAAIIGTDTPVSFAAVMATSKMTSDVSPATTPAKFLASLHAVTQPDVAPASVKYRWGMWKCKKLLENNSQVGVTIVFGSRTPRDTARAADFAAGWTKAPAKNAVYAVTAGRTDDGPYATITGSAKSVFDIDGFFELSEVLVANQRVCV